MTDEQEQRKKTDNSIGTVRMGKNELLVHLGFDPASKPLFHPNTASQGHDEHHKEHADEMGISLKQWKKQASDLLNALPCDDFYDWYSPERQRFFRYDLRTKCLAVGDFDGNIKTYFKLKNDAVARYVPQEYLAMLKKKK